MLRQILGLVGPLLLLLQTTQALPAVVKEKQHVVVKTTTITSGTSTWKDVYTTTKTVPYMTLYETTTRAFTSSSSSSKSGPSPPPGPPGPSKAELKLSSGAVPPPGAPPPKPAPSSDSPPPPGPLSREPAPSSQSPPPDPPGPLPPKPKPSSGPPPPGPPGPPAAKPMPSSQAPPPSTPKPWSRAGTSSSSQKFSPPSVDIPVTAKTVSFSFPFPSIGSQKETRSSAAKSSRSSSSSMAKSAASTSSSPGGFSVPTFSVPTFSAPSFSVPSFSTPSFSTPKVSAPMFSTPSPSTPKLSVPTFSAPSSSAPTFSAPSFSAPSFRATSLSTPKLNVPTFSTPSFSKPSFSAPSISAPTFSAPTLSAPSFSAPSLSASSFSAPSISAPSFSAPTFSQLKESTSSSKASMSTSGSSASAPSQPASKTSSSGAFGTSSSAAASSSIATCTANGVTYFSGEPVVEDGLTYIVQCSTDNSQGPYDVVSVSSGGFSKCFDACAASSRCQGFTFSGMEGGTCYLKDAEGTAIPAGSNIVSAFIVGPRPDGGVASASSALAGMLTSSAAPSLSTPSTQPVGSSFNCQAISTDTGRLTPYVDSNGKEYEVACKHEVGGANLAAESAASFGDCFPLCDKLSGCAGFAWLGGDGPGTCYFKSGFNNPDTIGPSAADFAMMADFQEPLTSAGAATTPGLSSGVSEGPAAASSALASEVSDSPAAASSAMAAVMSVHSGVAVALASMMASKAAAASSKLAGLPGAASGFLASVPTSVPSASSPVASISIGALPTSTGAAGGCNSALTAAEHPDYVIECAMDRNGGNLRAVSSESFDDCFTICNDVSGCVGFSYVGGSGPGTCYLKSSLVAPDANPNVDTAYMRGQQVLGAASSAASAAAAPSSASAAAAPSSSLAKSAAPSPSSVSAAPLSASAKSVSPSSASKMTQATSSVSKLPQATPQPGGSSSTDRASSTSGKGELPFGAGWPFCWYGCFLRNSIFADFQLCNNGNLAQCIVRSCSPVDVELFTQYGREHCIV